MGLQRAPPLVTYAAAVRARLRLLWLVAAQHFIFASMWTEQRGCDCVCDCTSGPAQVQAADTPLGGSLFLPPTSSVYGTRPTASLLFPCFLACPMKGVSGVFGVGDGTSVCL